MLVDVAVSFWLETEGRGYAATTGDDGSIGHVQEGTRAVTEEDRD